MSFNYHKNKEGGAGDSFWTSYSDLFLGMSVVFLLLYVTSSLRVGTSGLQSQIENRKLSMQVDDLKNQLKSYESLKKDYINKEASKDEAQEYNELMDKLSLLQEEAHDERDKLARQSQEQQTKEKALNQYQQMVRNMINANTLAKKKIQRREGVIENQDETIDNQGQEISQLETDVKQKQRQINENEQKIADAKEKLDEHLKQLKLAYKKNKMTERAYANQMAKIKADSQAKLQQLSQVNQTYGKQLAQAEGQLGQAKQELQKTQGALQATTGALQATKGQLQAAAGELGAAKGKLGAVQNELGAAKGALGQTKEQLEAAKGQLGQAKGELGEAKGKLGQAQGQIGQLQGDLAKAKAEADARKEITNRIKNGFAKAGVKADIDERTGEVVINFGDVYFDNDSAKLKPKMREVLQKAMPEYSKALLGDAKLKNKITSVEIVGFSSPTYQGKYVDPKSLDPAVRKAVDYNLDLSYKRAKSIFQDIFDEQKMNFSYQKDLLPLIKVTGRSFLPDKVDSNRNPSSKNFCDSHDCKKAQRVIIKFSFDDKK